MLFTFDSLDVALGGSLLWATGKAALPHGCCNNQSLVGKLQRESKCVNILNILTDRGDYLILNNSYVGKCEVQVIQPQQST